jgi:hypothetical protein
MTFAKQRLASLAKLAIAVSGVTVTLVVLPGCDDAHQADRRVRDTIAEARSKRAKTPGTEGMQAAEAELKKAAAESSASAATQANAKAILGQAQYEAALTRIADPQVGIDAGNREVLRLLWEINQLANQIDASNSLARVYKQMEPKEARSAVQQRILEATGDPSKPAWVGEGPAAVPTLTAVQGQVQQSQDAVAKQQELVKGLQAQQEQLSTQAQQAASQAEAARGRAGLDLFRQAVGLRKQAADVATRIDAENARLAQLQHDLNLAQARQQAVTTAVEQFKKVGEQIETGWKGVEAQTVQLQQLATQILSGGQPQVASSIAEKSKALVDQLNKNKEAFEAAQQSLTDAGENYGAAASAASKLLGEIGPKESELTAGNPMKDALKVMKETYNPAIFKVEQATAQLALANLQVSRAQTLAERARLIDRLSKVLGEAGLSLPKELEDSTLAASIKDATEQATTNFTSANELFSGVGDGAAPDAVKRGGRSGKIYSLYGQALLARATGASPDQLLATARSERDLAIQESPTALAALPAELVPPPSTQPAATPGTGAPTAPAATTPAEGAAPTDGTAPAATTPAEETTPATPPADGAAPATPATPPADSAAPAAPATPPADGAAPATPATPPADGAAPVTPPTDGAAPAAPADGAAAPATPPADGAAAPAAPATPAPQ